jgi:hypothetical protein
MQWWWQKPRPEVPDAELVERLRSKYASFRELLDSNSECLELMAGLQEDLQYVAPRGDIAGLR